MNPIFSAEGMKINWMNYRTGIKDVYFRMNTGRGSNWIGISIEQRDKDIRELYFDQFLELRTMLHTTLEEEWIWQRDAKIDDKSFSRIYCELPNASVLNREQWHDLIAFFKPRIIALDTFWTDAKYSFDALR